MEPSKNYNHAPYNSMEPENTGPGPSSQGFMNVNVKPVEVKPVLNYSIQTGEEFALEFMRDRVNPRKPFVPYAAGDPSATTGYLEIKGILGISHTGSESGSDISMINIVERGSKDLERNNSSYEDTNNYGSMPSVPRASSEYNSHRTLIRDYSSSGASDRSLTRIKILCSFGGKILPRPSDGKLRYVGGETRIIRISKYISWQELWQKTIAIYNETCTIKYQLPGEDLDALVSVSCDEDLQNMMEECNVLGEGEASKKLRMFLFSLSDLDDTHFGLANSGGDSEIQYVVAVNGMDMGSRRDSSLHGLGSSSANNLDELDGQNTERDISRAATDFIGSNASPLTGINVSSSVTLSSQPTLPSSCNAYNTQSQLNQGLMMHPGEAKQNTQQYGSVPRPVASAPFGESSVSLPFDGLGTEEGGLTEEQPSNAVSVQDLQPAGKEAKLKGDSSVRQEVEHENFKSPKNDYLVPSQQYNGNVVNYFPAEDSSGIIPTAEGKYPLRPSINEERHQEPVHMSSAPGTVGRAKVPKSDDSDLYTSSSTFAPEYVNSGSDLIDLSYLEPPVPPPRVYHSERIPRGQSELNRLTKSDDSLGSQFLITHSRSDVGPQDFISESVEKLHNEDLPPQHEQPISTAKRLYTDSQNTSDGLPKIEKLKESVQENMNNDYASDGNQILKVGHEISSTKGKDKSIQFGKIAETGSEIEHHEDSEGNLPEFHWGDQTGSDFTGNNTQAHAQPPAPGVSRPERGDILIDINDRFPRDFLSDIFTRAMLSEDSSVIGALPKDGAGLSLNIANHEPKHWSFFQKLAGDEFPQKDVSLIDQDHLGFSSTLPKVEEEATTAYNTVQLPQDEISDSQLDSRNAFVEDDKKVDTLSMHSHSQVKGSEHTQFDDLAENMRLPDSEYEVGIGNIGPPSLYPSLDGVDLSALQIIKNEDLEELRELGSGTFGTVYHGKWRGTDVAIKRIKKSCFAGRSSEQERLTIEFWREADILSKLHHPNVVAFYGVVQDGPGGTLATVTEFMVDGSLRHVLLRKDRHLDHRKRLIIAMDAAFGMEYLHSKDIVHFDLKCDNLLVNMKDASRPICKVGDFGLSKIKRNTLVSGGVRGTLPWMAPELLNGSSSKVSEKVDVFSFGIVLWEILTGEEPYANMHYGAIIGGIVNNTLRPSIPRDCDPEWRRLMEQCWAPNPAIRPSFTEITNRLRVMSAAHQSKAQVHKASS